MPHLFEPIAFRGVTLRNRVGVSPMCMYSCEDGHVNSWHLVHLGSRAAGGAGVVIAEATAVEARGRISVADAGIWDDAHVESWRPVTRFIASQGAVPAIQLAHAGRKAGWSRPWPAYRLLGTEEGGWTPIGPSAVAFNEKYPTPEAMSLTQIAQVIAAFASAARRAVEAGFTLIELHAAHGYLMHSFLSPFSNRRTDAYGGSFDGRARFVCEIASAVRAVLPDRTPLWLRLSCSDWADGGWTIDDSVALAGRLKTLGVDAIDCSSGGSIPDAKIPQTPGYQVPFAERIRREAGIATAAVGLITEASQADAIVREGRADVALIARASLRDPNWPLNAAKSLGQALAPPVQYGRGW